VSLIGNEKARFNAGPPSFPAPGERAGKSGSRSGVGTVILVYEETDGPYVEFVWRAPVLNGPSDP
jgi:hypothetical protein